MNKLLLIPLMVLFSLSGKTQDSLTTLGGTIEAFYAAIQDTNAAERATRLGKLVLPEARMNAITMTNPRSARIALGGVDDFLKNSAAFYNTYRLTLDEFDRSTDYYADMASVNSLVYQTAVRLSDGKQFQQEIWYTLDLVFKEGRWFIAHATWTTAVDGFPMEPNTRADTLWHESRQR